MKQLKMMVLLFVTMGVNFAHAADKRIGILVYDGVLTSDVTAPLEVFGVASRQSWFSDYDVETVSVNESEFITTEEGLTIKVDRWIGDDVEYDAFITTSAYDMEDVLESQHVQDVVKATYENGGFIASNCSGSWLLAESGLLDSRKATTWAGGEDDFKDAYPKVNVQFDQNVVIDGRILTSNGSLVSYQAALTLLRLMSSESRATEVAETLQYARFSQAPF